MRLRYFFVRAAAATLAIGSAAPVDLPYEIQGLENALSANAVAPVRPVYAYRPPAPREAQTADAEGLHGDRRLLKIGKDGDLPCDSGEWATNSLFGPHAGLAAALGVKPSGTENGIRDAALAAALDDRPAMGDADSSAFGSVFGNASHPPLGGGGGDLFNTGTGTTGGTGGGTGGPAIGGGGTGTGGGIVTGGGTGTGTGTGGDPTIGGGTNTGGGPFTGGGTDPTGGTGSGPGKSGGTGGGTSGTGSTGGTGATGRGSSGGNSATQPDAPGAVPEPSSWATILAGFGLIGGTMRWRRRKPRLA